MSRSSTSLTDAPWGSASLWQLPLANDCGLSAKYATALISGINEPPFRDVAAFFGAMFPEENLSNDTVLAYHDFAWEHDHNYRREIMFREVVPECRGEICEAVGLKMVDGLVGYGLLTGMVLQAVLATMYIVVTIVLFAKRRRAQAPVVTPRIEDATRLDRILYAFQGTQSDFLLSSAIFNMGLAIGALTSHATLKTVSSHLGYRTTEFGSVVPATRTSAESSGVTILVACFSIMPLAAVLPCLLWSSRRQWFRGRFLVLVWFIAAAAIIVVVTVSDPMNGVGIAWDTQVVLCPDEYVPGGLQAATQFPTIGVGIFCPVLFLISFGVVSSFWRCSGSRMWKESTWARRVVRFMTLSFSGVCFVIMWMILIILLVFVSGTTWFDKTAWDLGQGIALAMWVPLLLEIGYVMNAGIDKASQSRLPNDLFVVRGDESEDPEQPEDEGPEEPELVPGAVLGPRGRRIQEVIQQQQNLDDMVTAQVKAHGPGYPRDDYSPPQPGHLPRPPTPPGVGNQGGVFRYA